MNTSPSLVQERMLWSQGLSTVVGVDEVGRGAWAGPIVSAAVILSPESSEFDALDSSLIQLPKLLRDSKKLSPIQRQEVASQLASIVAYSSIGQVEVEEINDIGIGRANILAMQRAIKNLPVKVDHILVDGFPISELEPEKQTAIVKGDATVASIAAASVVAKVHRDTLMEELAHAYPEYGFAQHKGYGTKTHQQSIQQLGLCPIHRTNYRLKFLRK